MILAIETAGATTQLGLYKSTEDAQPAQLEWESGRSLADDLLGRIQSFLADHQAQFSDLTGIIIFSGPGSFTSLRIGHTVANTLADSLNIPVIGARGDAWQRSALAEISGAQPGRPALPFYGAEANITRPKS